MSIYPIPIIAGQESSLIINSSEGKAEIKNLPEVNGLRWLQSNHYSSNIMIINGTKYIKTSYPFVVSKPGKVTLPSMVVTVGSKNIETAEKDLLVSGGPLANLDKKLFIKCKYSKEKKDYYIGEEVSLEINVFMAQGLTAKPAEYPSISLENIVFDDFSNINKFSDKFAPYPYNNPVKVSIDGIDYIKTTFFTSFRPLSPEKLSGSVSVTFNVSVPHSRNNHPRSIFDDSFFDPDSFFSNSLFNRSKTIPRIVTEKLPELNIKPLPIAPANTNYLGLIGNWKVQYKFSGNKFKEGEPVDLKLKIIGKGSTEALNPPDISIPGFNIYSPEVKKDIDQKHNTIGIDYVLVPVEPGKSNIDISFATFNVDLEKYDITKIHRAVEISPGTSTSFSSSYFQKEKANRKSLKKTPEKKVSSSILYLKMKPENYIKVPLYKNNFLFLCFILFAGPVIWILFELILLRKRMVSGNIAFKRKNTAHKRKNTILKKLRKTENIKMLSEVVQKDVIPYINDINGFPPGTTSKEIENKLKNITDIGILKDVESSAYMPSSEGNSENIKRKIIKIVSRASIFILMFCFFFVFCNTGYSSSCDTKEIALLAKNYNQGKFKEALKICKSNIKPNRLNSEWLYNTGNCYYQMGNLPEALIYYERALRISPRDSDILENLNLVRRKMFLPELNQTNDPLHLILFMRNSLRPDEWILVFSVFFFLLFCSLIVRRYVAPRIWFALFIVCIIFAVLSITASITEKNSLYNSKNAIIVERNLKTYTLPTTDSSNAEITLVPGDQIKIEEQLKNWYRIRKGKSEGWINKKAVEQIWPY